MPRRSNHRKSEACSQAVRRSLVLPRRPQARGLANADMFGGKSDPRRTYGSTTD